MPQRNIFSWNSIISVLTKLGYVDDAVGIFSSMHEHGQCSWNLIIYGFAQQDRFDEALHSFVRMHGDDFVLNEYSFGSSLGACSGLKDVILGAQIHALISKTRIPWKILITCYEQNGLASAALQVFLMMMDSGIEPDELTLASVVIACALKEEMLKK
ncbi:hypothetical protein V6N11_081909 [Hibiscus sabdariffa]|uniref:Pentatricopeptide repeat-containing protein n=1 Tax=Hibiscus sabdariffa TaxID=183260 RepID=A0ABR2Q7J6_9ROSI